MSFAAPSLLFGLLALPLAVLGYAQLERRRRRRATSWAEPALLPNVVRRPGRRFGQLPALLFLLALTLLLVGWARPEQVLGRLKANPPTVVLALDVSGSMAASDVPPSRLAAARTVALALLRALPAADRVALVSFGDVPRLLVAPTADRKLVAERLPRTIIPRDGTAIGDAVSYAVSVVVGADGQSAPGALYRPGAVVLVSDGGQNAGGISPDDAAVTALVDYVPVDAIAVGSADAAVSQTTSVDGTTITRRIAVPVDPATLRTLAHATGGSFLEQSAVAADPARLAALGTRLRAIGLPGRRTRELSALLGGAALLLVLAGVGLSGLWYGRVA